MRRPSAGAFGRFLSGYRRVSDEPGEISQACVTVIDAGAKVGAILGAPLGIVTTVVATMKGTIEHGGEMLAISALSGALGGAVFLGLALAIVGGTTRALFAVLRRERALELLGPLVAGLSIGVVTFFATPEGTMRYLLSPGLALVGAIGTLRVFAR